MNTSSSQLPKSSEREILSSRLFNHSPEKLFDALADPKHIVHWWGPKGFSSVVHSFEFKPGGLWVMDMIGPDGTCYPNRSTFVEIVPNQKVVFSHDSEPKFTMTITFEPKNGGTLLTWRQEFKTAAIRDRVAVYAVPANEQNYDRLEEFLRSEPSRSAVSSNTADREITAVRLFDAPPDLVYQAWTDPKQVSQWWGPNGFTTTTSKMEVKPGGVWLHTMHGPDGTDYPNKITFLEVKAPERLVYHHGDEDDPEQFHVTITFENDGGKTRLSMRMLFRTAEEKARVVDKYGAIEGLNQTLGRLKVFLAKA